MRSILNMIIQIGIIELFSVIFIFLNALTFFLYFTDKKKAERKSRRISEKTLIFFTLACGGIGAFLGMIVARHKTNHFKFRLAVAIGLIVAIIPVIHIAHGLTLDRSVRYLEIEFHSANWPAELDGYRIVFMTDMHDIPDEEMGKVASELNKRGLDLLLLGGDYSMRNAHYRGTMGELARINAVDGIFGVEGNHDDRVRLFSEKEQHGITSLDNSGKHVRDGFFLAGVRDLWGGDPNIGEAVESSNADDFILLISHNPDVTMEQPTNGIDLVLSGHTHGGQITLFGFPIYLFRGSITEYGARFAHGFAHSLDGVPVFVSKGVGPYFAVPRIFARPEVVIFTMYSERIG